MLGTPDEKIPEKLKKKSKCDRCISGLLFALGIFAIFAYTKAGVLQLLNCSVSVLLLWYFSVYDMKTRTISAAPVYAAFALIFLLRFFAVCRFEIEKIPVFMLECIVVFIALYVLSRFFKGKIGNGDFDIAYIIYLSIGLTGLFYAFIVACVLSLILNMRSIINNRKNIKTFSVPFIPYMYIGYVTVLLFLKEAIAV